MFSLRITPVWAGYTVTHTDAHTHEASDFKLDNVGVLGGIRQTGRGLT